MYERYLQLKNFLRSRVQKMLKTIKKLYNISYKWYRKQAREETLNFFFIISTIGWIVSAALFVYFCWEYTGVMWNNRFFLNHLLDVFVQNDYRPLNELQFKTLFEEPTKKLLSFSRSDRALFKRFVRIFREIIARNNGSLTYEVFLKQAVFMDKDYALDVKLGMLKHAPSVPGLFDETV